ncbi:Fur family transcriptional regulator [Allofranklinella schreckenbergeri]
MKPTPHTCPSHSCDPMAHPASPEARPRERSTRQRAAIRAAMAAEGRPLSPPEILQAAQKIVPRLGIATVYRNIKTMVEAGELSLVPLPGDRLYYELSCKGHEHHHHFCCESCGKVFDVGGCHETFAALLPQGFVLKAHELTLYGTCDHCANTADATPAP